MIAPTEVGPSLSPDALLSEMRDELKALYKELDEAVAMKGPVCQLSGRCCRFKGYGHTLFLSAPEALLLVADAPQPPGRLDSGESCPWQDARGHCTARDARPLGCRVYFCDPSFETHAPELSEAFLGAPQATGQQAQLALGLCAAPSALEAGPSSGPTANRVGWLRNPTRGFMQRDRRPQDEHRRCGRKTARTNPGPIRTD